MLPVCMQDLAVSQGWQRAKYTLPCAICPTIHKRFFTGVSHITQAIRHVVDASVNLIFMMWNRNHRQLYLLLLLLIWLAFGLRLIGAQAYGFWTDEGLTPLRASYPVAEILSNRIIIQEAVTKDTHPPLFYLLVHGSRQLWGESDFAYRYLPLLAGVLLIPLLYQLGRRLHGVRLGLMVALVTAVNPLQLYYANEARMYTLLALLTAGMSYVLWRVLQSEEMRRLRDYQSPHLSIAQYLLFYGVLAALAVYTHYTAVFLIAGQGLFWVWLLWRREHKRLLVGTAVAAILLAIPLIPFTIPRLFTGAEANYYYVSPLIMLQDVVRFFHLGRSVEYETTAVKLINLGAFALLLLGLYAPRNNLKRAFLLVYLLSVVLGLMAGSLLKPMYQGVRHIFIGSPAFLLIVSWGLVFAAEQWQRFRLRATHHRSLPPAHCLLWPLLTFASALILLGGSLAAVGNYFFDGRYGKDDFRAMIAFIEARAGENDVIVYNNAILLPLHEQYQTRPDVALTAVPLYPHAARDVAPAQLEKLAATYDRLWFITDPPADGRDDDQITRAWLDSNLAEVANVTFPSTTAVVQAIAYETTPRAADTLPDSAQPLAIEWPGWPRLAGVELAVTQPVAVPTLWVSLYWQGTDPATGQETPGTAVRFMLQDALGATWWASQDQWLQPPDAAWPDSEWVRQSYQLPLPPGLLPGRYTLLTQPVTGLAGDPIDVAQPLAEVEVAPGSEWPVPSAITTPPAIVFDNGLALAKVELYDTAVRPGHTLPLNLYWQTGAETAVGLGYELEVIRLDGSQLRTQSDPIGARWLESLPPHTLLREPTGLYFSPETEPGVYRLRWQLRQGETVIKGRPFWWPWAQEHVVVGTINVLPWPLETELPANVDPARVLFGADIGLYGYEVAQTDTAVNLTLYWQTINRPPENYRLFVHLVNEAGEIVGQIDPLPGNGLRPTKGWRPGEVITDQPILSLPPDLPPGTYTLWLGLYQPDTGARLPVTVKGDGVADGRLLLGTIDIPEDIPE